MSQDPDLTLIRFVPGRGEVEYWFTRSEPAPKHCSYCREGCCLQQVERPFTDPSWEGANLIIHMRPGDLN